MSEDKIKQKILKKFEKELEGALEEYEFLRVKCSALDKLVTSLKSEIEE